MDRPGTRPGQVKRIFIEAICATCTVALAVLPSPQHVSAGNVPSNCVLRWGIINTPGSFPQRNDIVSPCEITALSASPDGQVLYAVDQPNTGLVSKIQAGIWKSTDGGISWSSNPTLRITGALPAPTGPFSNIAQAPDCPEFVAVISIDASTTGRREVYFSEDGGANWTYSGHIPWMYGADEQAGSLAISPSYTAAGKTVRDIVIGSRIPADGLAQGQIYILSYPGMAGWKAQGFTNGDIITLAVSPSYTTDGSLIVMSSTTQRTYINIGSRDFGINSCLWNTAHGWPVELCPPGQSGGTGSGESRIITGSLSTASDFNGAEPAQRIIFAAYDSNGKAIGGGRPLDDVYRLNDTIVTGLKVPWDGSSPRITSLSCCTNINGGKLLAGCAKADAATGAATVWYTSDPFNNSPCWTRPLKPPTGGYGTGYANVILAWVGNGKNALCGTGTGNRDTPAKWRNPVDPAWMGVALDESAFSVSLDDAESWNQLGLIDTKISNLGSVEASPDGNTIYVSSRNDQGLDSAWRSTTEVIGETWQRVLCHDCDQPLLKIPPDKEDGSVIFVGARNHGLVMHSRNGGRTWQECLPGIIITDMAAISSDRLIILQRNGLVRCGSYSTAGWKWSGLIDTGLQSAHTIVALGNNVLAGAGINEDRPVAYSTDWGDHWMLITQPTYSSGNRHVAFDDEFKDNRIIYLADDAGGLYRWSIGTSNRWDDMVPANSSYYGIVALPRDIIYAAYSPGSSGVDRTLYSRAGIPKGGMSWDSLSSGLNKGVCFTLEPSALTCHSDTILAIDSRAYQPLSGEGLLWGFKDTLAKHGPWLISPKGGTLLGCDPVSGRNAQVDLRWEQLSLADSYEIEVGKDKWFDLAIREAAPATNPFFSPNDLRFPCYYIAPGALPEAGHTYYWHIRVRKATTGQVIRSPWSYALSFNISPGFPVVERAIPPVQSSSTAPGGTSPTSSTPVLIDPSNNNATNLLLMVLIMVILFGLSMQVILYHRNKNR